ncbi:DUF5959 family protein [Nocardiopsis sp. NPDC101807]|uniref:DUF5959 family protein n=1 Tax=Nocardiopsis sp. NPDC101807 TaxID=3364339 RepID=UPI003804849F
MTGEVRVLELFRFADPVQGVAVEVELSAPRGSGQECFLGARLVLESGFVNGRLALALSSGDLDDWERCLDDLHAEKRAVWPRGDRTAWLEVAPEDPVEVTVHDMPSTQIAVRMPIDVAEDWLEENPARPDRVREAVGR